MTLRKRTQSIYRAFPFATERYINCAGIEIKGIHKRPREMRIADSLQVFVRVNAQKYASINA